LPHRDSSSRGRRRSYLLKIPAILIMGGIWFLSSQSVLPQPKGILGFDKLQHFLAYGVLAFCFSLWFHRGRFGSLFLVFRIGASSLYGIIDEVHQYFVPGRDCNIWDWIADCLGSILGALFFLAAAHFWKKRHNL